MKIKIDIETIPAQSDDAIEMIKENINVLISKLKAPANYGGVKAVEWVLKKTSELQVGFSGQHLKTSFDGGLGEICCIGVKIEDHETKSFMRTDEKSETDVLCEFFEYLDIEIKLKGGSTPKIQWVGHNVIKFDLPFIFKRCVINEVKPCVDIPPNARHGVNAFDTMQAWSGYREMISQDNLCRILGLQTKQGMDGSKVYDAWLKKEYKKIALYCEDDVDTVHSLYCRMHFIDNVLGDIPF